MAEGRRKEDYRRLDEIGFDVVDARFGQILQHVRREDATTRYPESKAARLTAEEFKVAQFNLQMWMRRKRTITFLADTDPEEILDLIAHGYTPADLSAEYDISVRVVEEWIRVHCAAEDIANAKDAMADMKFTHIRREIMDAKNEAALKQALAAHTIDKHVAAAHSRRYSEDKQIRVNAGAGVAMEISFVRKRRETSEEPPA